MISGIKSLRQIVQELIHDSPPLTILGIREKLSHYAPKMVDDTLWALVEEGWCLLKNDGPTLRYTV